MTKRFQNIQPAEFEPDDQEHMHEKSKNGSAVIKAVILAVFLVAVLTLVRFSPLGEYLKMSNVNNLQQKLAGFQHWASFIFFLVGALLIALGVPRSLISILGGMVFGLFWGILLSMAATLGGSVVIFLLTRWLGRPLFNQKVGPYLTVIEQQYSRHDFLLVVLLRQLPLTCILVSVLIGLTFVSLSMFLLGSVVGLLPQTIIFTLFGSSLKEHFALRTGLAVFLLVFHALAIKLYYDRSPLARELAQKLICEDI